MAGRKSHREIVRNIVLIGGRGCGKSSVSKRIAQDNRNFMLFSVDALVRYEAGARTIPAIVAQEGWQGFRDREYEVVRKLSAFEAGAVIDCGGGVVVDLDEHGEEIYSKRKVDALRRHGLVVYLSRDPEYLRERISNDPDRPTLSESRSFVDVMERRDPWYRAAADLVIDGDGLDKITIAKKVLSWFYRQQDGRPA
jgi:shikimate kinase